jgi:hypothetical protein
MMDALARFEELAEQAVETSFTRLLKSQLQPVEIAKRLARAMESQQTIGVDKVWVPNQYEVHLNPADYDGFAPFRAYLERELAACLSAVAQERGFSLVASPLVRLQADEQVPSKRLRIVAQTAEVQAVAAEASVPAGFTPTMRVERLRPLARTQATLALADGSRTFPLDKPVLNLGRSLDNDVILDDPRVSRRHAQISHKHGHFCLYDLESANGTLVNGQAVRDCVLQDGDVVSLGGVELVFREMKGKTAKQQAELPRSASGGVGTAAADQEKTTGKKV